MEQTATGLHTAGSGHSRWLDIHDSMDRDLIYENDQQDATV